MRDLYHVPEILERIAVIRSFEEDKYSDIPKWDGWVETWTEKAVLLHLNFDPPRVRGNQYWFPYSVLRKAGDDASIYAADWFLEKSNI